MIRKKVSFTELQARWLKKQNVLDEVVKILKTDEDPDGLDENEVQNMLNNANKVLVENGFQEMDYFELPCGPEETIRIPMLDLRGALLSDKDCSNILLSAAVLDEVDFQHTNLMGSRLEFASFRRGDLFYSDLSYSHMQWTNFNFANMSNSKMLFCYMWKTSFYGANLEYSEMLGSDLPDAILDYTNLFNVRLKGCKFMGTSFIGADFSSSVIGKLKSDDYPILCKISKKEFEDNIKYNETSIFENNSYLPKWRDLIKNYKIKTSLRLIKGYSFDMWFYTKFSGVRIGDADLTMAKDLYKYINDQQYLSDFKIRHPYIYRIWKIFSDCGGKLSVVGFWGIVFILLFAIIYWAMATPVPGWLEPIFPDFLTIKEFPINPKAFFEDGNSIVGFWKWIFISFDIFSNLGLRSTQPQNPLGVLLVITESVLGFMMLGMLISVLANRFARRS